MNKLKVLSLFTGSGGLDCGFELNGKFDIKMAVDVDRQAAISYCNNFGFDLCDSKSENTLFYKKTYLVGDITNIDFQKYKDSFGNPDVIIGGPPCQDFSIMRGPDRANGGLNVERGRLYSYFVKSLILLRPKYFVFENVGGLVTDNKGKSWETIKEDFTNLSSHAEEIRKKAGDGFSASNIGYELVYSNVVDASSVGVPQRRLRTIILGVRKDLVYENHGLIKELHQIPKRILGGDSSLLNKYPLTVMEAFEGAPLDELVVRYKEIMEEWVELFQSTRLRRPKDWLDQLSRWYSGDVVKDYCHINSIEGCDEMEFDQAMREHKEVLKRLGYYGDNVSKKKFADSSNQHATESKKVLMRLKFTPPDKNYEFINEYKSMHVEGKKISFIYKRVHPLKPSYTVVAKGGGGTHGYHYQVGRSRLTNRENARLQSFPDDVEFTGYYFQRRSQIGEAVPPLLGAAISDIIVIIDSLLETSVESEITGKLKNAMPAGLYYSRSSSTESA